MAEQAHDQDHATAPADDPSTRERKLSGRWTGVHISFSWDSNKLHGWLRLESSGEAAPSVDPEELIRAIAGIGVEITPTVRECVTYAVAALADGPMESAMLVAGGMPAEGRHGSWKWVPGFDAGDRLTLPVRVVAAQPASKPEGSDDADANVTTFKKFGRSLIKAFGGSSAPAPPPVIRPPESPSGPADSNLENVDHRERGMRTVSVMAGQQVAEMVPPKLFVPGRDIFGQPISKVFSPVPPLKLGKNLQQDESGHVASLIDGELVRRGNEVSVDPVLSVPTDVDFGTGNIHFTGIVKVAKDVLDSFVVEGAMGVNVGGVVGAATVTANNGSVQLSGGINGRDIGSVKASVDIHSKYVNEAKLEAGHDITVDKDAVASTMLALGKVTVANRIIGGLTTAGHMVEAGTLGSSAGVMTRVIVGAGLSTEQAARVRVRVKKRLFARTVIQIGPRVTREFGNDVAGPIEVLLDTQTGEIKTFTWLR